MHAFYAVRDPCFDTSREVTYEATSSFEDGYDHEDGYCFDKFALNFTVHKNSIKTCSFIL